MSDNKKKEDGRDDSKIDVKDSAEVAYAAKAFDTTAAKIKQAVEAVGSSREKVGKYIKDKK